MKYATITDVQNRMTTQMSDEQEAVCGVLLDDAGALIDAYNDKAPDEAKRIVSCRLVMRALDASDNIPLGATQGSMSGLGYSQSWTVGSGGSVGELYLTKTEKKLLGVGDMIGSHSPVEDMR